MNNVTLAQSYLITEEYSRDDALKAISDARFVVGIAEQVIKPDR